MGPVFGFTYRWIASREGKGIISHTTSKKKFNTSEQKLKKWIKENINNRIRKIIDLLNVKLRGYYKIQKPFIETQNQQMVLTGNPYAGSCARGDGQPSALW